MSRPAPDQPSADRNLLFGILAVQMDFASRDALIAAMSAWCWRSTGRWAASFGTGAHADGTSFKIDSAPETDDYAE
jgi:hypothetical protein